MYLIVSVLLIALAAILFTGSRAADREGRHVDARLDEIGRGGQGVAGPVTSPSGHGVRPPSANSSILSGAGRPSESMPPAASVSQSGVGRRDEVEPARVPPIQSALRRLCEAAPPASTVKARARLDRAGLSGPFAAEVLLAARLVCAFLGLAFAAGIATSVEGYAIPAVAGGVALALLPDGWVARRAAIRRRMIERSLPDRIDLLVVSLEAGTGFDSALSRITERTTGPVSDEFARTLSEIRVGRSRADTLRAMAERSGVDDMAQFVSAVRHAETLGLGMARSLRDLAAAMRRRRLVRAREEAQKLQVKILFRLILFVFPATFVVIAGPGLIRIYDALLR